MSEKQKIGHSFKLTILLILLMSPVIVNAQPVDIVAILGRVQDIFFAIFDGLIVIMVVWAAFLYVTARGEPSKVSSANKALIWALVGVAVGILANAVSGIVNWLLNG